jgi:hypothetical protein
VTNEITTSEVSECVLDEFLPLKPLKVILSCSLNCILLVFRKDVGVVQAMDREGKGGSH